MAAEERQAEKSYVPSSTHQTFLGKYSSSLLLSNLSNLTIPAALSSRGTLVLESAMKNALLSLEEALSEHARRLQECQECVPCLFGDCGNWTGECACKLLILVCVLPCASKVSCAINHCVTLLPQHEGNPR